MQEESGWVLTASASVEMNAPRLAPAAGSTHPVALAQRGRWGQEASTCLHRSNCLLVCPRALPEVL